jgi:hypothetical protein
MAVGGEPVNPNGPAGVTWVVITSPADCANWLAGPTGTGNRGGFWTYYTGSEPSATAFCSQMLQDISAQANGQPTSGKTIDSNGEIRKWFTMPSPWYGLYVSDIIARTTSGPAIAPFNPNTGGACN